MSDNYEITKAKRISLLAQRPFVLWFTGLSASGKSTIANAVDIELHNRAIKTYVLDGDILRDGLSSNLGFSEADRCENIRRVGEVTKLFLDAGIIVLTAFISPFSSDRDRVRALLEDGEFIEIFVDTPISICESRDPKGLYKKARDGVIKQFTGIDSPYEAPIEPDIHIKTEINDIKDSAKMVIEYLIKNNYLPKQ
jgi:adenylylsulfate kinase